MKEIYNIPKQPIYDPEIRQLRDTDPASASQTFNPLFEKMIENTAAVKVQAEESVAELKEAIGELEEASSSMEEAKGQPGGLATLDNDGKIPADQLPPMDYDQAGAATVVQSELDSHKSDGDLHVTADKQGKWDEATTAASEAKRIAEEAKMTASSAKGKKYATFVVGHVNGGHTLDEVDFLCTGSNDQNVINRVIQELPDRGGKIIMRAGDYNITSEILLDKDNVTLEGEGNSTVLKRGWDGTTINGILSLLASHCSISGLSFEGKKDMYTHWRNCSIYLGGTGNTNNIIIGNTCNENSGGGIHLGGSNNANNMITNNTCNNNTRGIYLAGSYGNVHTTTSTITGNVCNGNSSSGICASTGKHNVTGNNCNNNNGSGICLTSGENSVTGNLCIYNSSNGIFVQGSGVAIHGNTITGNNCDYNGSSGIDLRTSGNSTITGNTCNGNSRGIYLYGSNDVVAERNTVTGNTCNGNSISGIDILDIATGNNITGNTCNRNTYAVDQYSIRLGSDTQNNLVSSNCITGKNVTNIGSNNTLANNKYQ